MNSIQESYKTLPTHLNHIIPLDFKGVLRLPESHAWSQSNDYPSINSESIPVIDLANPKAIELVRHASEKWGMFQITNHGIPVHLIQQVEHQTRRLFALPAKQKLQALRSPDGFTGYGLARIGRLFPKLMWSEGFSVIGSPEGHARQLWPHDYNNFCDVMEEYQKEMKGLSEWMIGLMLNSLGLAHEEVKWFMSKFKHSQSALQLNSYPVCPDPTHAMGLAPHTDSSLMTLVHQSNTDGLQVLRDKVAWVNVPPVTGAFVVNVGDLLHIISNGRFKNALHRAVVNNAQHRVSIAYFYGPPKDVKISPLIKLTDPDHPPLYRPVLWKDYLDAKAICFHKALDLIRIDANRELP
ncbi:gibberellin 3-beta-dioxygenase 1-like [Cornus florida]|uniref:gibberellin 3-beta-dioxygenase 1-like n=1 Tax=Cornus florida TaxID=4283 RepID=UPI00289CB885|nr:gibberellin 3-beta-dioxygenase 1-like [Cornus florida]